jgi:hypothetical protein
VKDCKWHEEKHIILRSVLGRESLIKKASVSLRLRNQIVKRMIKNEYAEKLFLKIEALSEE